MKMRKELSPLLGIENEIFKNDYNEALKVFNLYPRNQFIRRSLTRSAFAYFEGSLFYFKQSIAGLKLVQYFQKMRSDKDCFEISPHTGFLGDYKYQLNDKGEIKKTVAFIPFETNLIYTFKEASETYFSSYKIDKNKTGWKVMMRAKKIRNRITHPKSAAEMEINDSEIQFVIEAANWFESAVNELLDGIESLKFLTSISKKKE
jgi:hypothetical protein